MEIYNYEENGKFAGISKADPSPLEPDTYLIPALATDKAPPIAKDGFEIYWNGTAWEYREAPKEKPEQPNEYSLWNEASWVWVEDAELKAAFDRNVFKSARQALVDAIKVTTASGNTFDGDETSQTRMSRAILGMTDTDTIPWILADNSVIEATRAELTEAMRLAGMEQARIWVMPS
ncbi:MAG: hypothetical protein AB1763_09480 [Campylobacterota bacterium]